MRINYILLAVFPFFGLSCSHSNSNQEIATYYHSAYSKFQARDYGGAIEDYTKAIKLNPQSDYAYYNRGNAKASLGNYNDAITDFNKAIELGPTNASYYNGLGGAECALENYLAALENYNMAMRLDPKAAFSYNNRGYVELCLKKYDEASIDFNKAKEIDSGLFSPYIGNGEANRGLKNYVTAISDFQKAIKINPQSDAAYKGLGMIDNDLFLLQSALTNFQISVALNPGQIDIKHRIYIIQMQLGQKKQVVEEIEKVINSPDYRMQAAEARSIGGVLPTTIELDEFLAGVLSESNFIRNATNNIWNTNNKKNQICLAYYYAGMKHLIDKDNIGARDFFQKCINLVRPNYGAEGYDEYGSAEAELNRLEN